MNDARLGRRQHVYDGTDKSSFGIKCKGKVANDLLGGGAQEGRIKCHR
jgi:hypothetical protein